MKKIAFFDFASCEGCQLQIINLEERLLDVLENVEIVNFREASDTICDNYDIAFVEGSIIRPIDVDRIKNIRLKAKFLVALGSCACNGGINKLSTFKSPIEAVELGYGELDLIDNPYFKVEGARAINEIVNVDFYIRGCPVSKEQILYYFNRMQILPLHKNKRPFFAFNDRQKPVDTRSFITYDNNKCILCRRCDTICSDILGVNALGVVGKGTKVSISTPADVSFEENGCINCGQCSYVCPVGALGTRSITQWPFYDVNNGNVKYSLAIDKHSVAALALNDPYLKNLKPDKAESIIVAAFRKAGFEKIMQYEQYIIESLKMDVSFAKKQAPENTYTVLSWCKGTINYINKKVITDRFNISEVRSPWNIYFRELEYKGFMPFIFSACSALKADKFANVLTCNEVKDLFNYKGIVFDMLGDSNDQYDNRVIDFLNPALTQCTQIFGEEVLTSLRISPDLKEEFYTLQKQQGIVDMYSCLSRCLTGGGTISLLTQKEVEERYMWIKMAVGVQCEDSSN